MQVLFSVFLIFSAFPSIETETDYHVAQVLLAMTLKSKDASKSESPITISENGNDLAFGADGIDVHGVAADHEVHVDHGIVDAQLLALLQCLVVVVADGIGEAAANSQMAGCVLIEQGVIEQNAAFADGALLGNQSALAEVGSESPMNTASVGVAPSFSNT